MSPTWKRSLIFTALLMSVAVAYTVYSEQAGPRFDAGLKKLEADAKSKLPMKVDEITTWVDVKYEASKSTYWYVMDVKAEETLDTHALEQGVRNQVCANADTLRTIREKGFSYEYHYVDKARAVLAAF